MTMTGISPLGNDQQYYMEILQGGTPQRKPCWQCCLRICRPVRWTHKGISCNCCCAWPKVTMIIENLHGLTRVARSLLLAWQLQRRREPWGTDIESEALLSTLLTVKRRQRRRQSSRRSRRQSRRKRRRQQRRQSRRQSMRKVSSWVWQVQHEIAGSFWFLLTKCRWWTQATPTERESGGAPVLSNCFILLIMHWAAYEINPQSVVAAPQWVVASISPRVSSVSHSAPLPEPPSVSCCVSFWLNFNFKCPETRVTC